MFVVVNVINVDCLKNLHHFKGRITTFNFKTSIEWHKLLFPSHKCTWPLYFINGKEFWSEGFQASKVIASLTEAVIHCLWLN
jgi:hypothetical protein